MQRSIRRAVVLMAGLSNPSPAVFGQASPAFEVLSIKPAQPGESHPSGISGNRFSFGPLPLDLLIGYAYNLRPYQVAGAPPTASQNYVIDAKSPGDAALSMDQARLMLRTALADRFGLKVHREMRETSVYELRVGASGAKLKASTAEVSGLQFTMSHVATAKSSMAALSNLLSILAGRPVLDKTGLMGDYEFDLKFTPFAELPPDAPDSQFAASADAPSPFMAIREQLRLRLDSAKAPIEVMVVDRWEKPSPN
jgi:uncharacterized protein (TIGR03435 family)